MNQVGDIIRPTSTALSSVDGWLRELGCQQIKYTPNQNWAQCQTTVGAIESSIPSASFFVFSHKRRSNPLIRSIGGFEVPAFVASNIDIISGINDFPPVKKDRVSVPETDDWSFRPSGGDSIMSVSVNYPNSLEAPASFQLKIDQDGVVNNYNFGVGDVSSSPGKDSVVYTLNANGLPNLPASVFMGVCCCCCFLFLFFSSFFFFFFFFFSNSHSLSPGHHYLWCCYF